MNTIIDILFSITLLIRPCQTMNLQLNFRLEHGIHHIYLHPIGQSKSYNQPNPIGVEIYNYFTMKEEVNN